MKALTNILTRLLMLMLLMLVACTEETAEVDNLVRQEQYVTVRMQVPGMTATTTRAADGVIESVTALAFDTNGSLLKVVSATNITTERFNLTVPNGTKNIHFLANLPENYDLSGVQKESDLTTLTTNDYENLVYWGMTTYEGTTNTLSTTLYRNMAKITLAPDEEFPFEGELTIAGLTNPNNWGYLVPWKDGVYTDGRVPNEPDPLTLTPIGNDGAGYGTSLYVLEHDNPNTNDGLYVICRIGDAFYKVALTSNGIDPYKIKRNHEYIIYVSDVDDYQADEYRTAIGDNIKDDYDIAAGKKPINLEVKELESVTFGETPQSIDVDGNLTVTMTVPEDGTVTALTISAPGFTIKQGGSYTGSGLNIVGNSTVTYTFVPNTFGKGKEITFTASGTNLQETIKNIKVDVNAAISASPTVNNPTLYYDQDGQTVTVNVTMPKGLSAINIGGAENFMVSQGGNAMTIDNDVYTYTRNDATATQIVQFEFTVDKSKYASQQGDTSATFTFTDASTAVDKATSASVNNISLIPTPEVTFSQSAETIYMGGDPLTVTMIVPNDGSVTLSIGATGFTVTKDGNELSKNNEGKYTYTGGSTTFTFVPTSIDATTITFTGSGTNLKDVDETIIVTVVKPTITAFADVTTLYYDVADQTTTVTVKIPRGVSALKIAAEDFTVTQFNNSVGNYGNDTYTLYNGNSEQTVQFVFTMNTVSSTPGKTSTAIAFSDPNNIATSPAPITIDLTEKPEEVTSLVVTPVGTTEIDLSESGNKKVKLTLSLPSTSGQIEILTNYMFKVTRIDEGMTQPQLNNGNYYYYNIDATTINLELELSDTHYLSTEGDYSITFNYNANGSTESVTTTITVVNDELSEYVIWEGSKEMTNAGYVLNYKSFKEYRNSEKQLKIDIEQTGDSWKQFYVRYSDVYNGNLLNGNCQGQTIDSTFSLEIPSEDRDLRISGEGGITITRIYVE